MKRACGVAIFGLVYAAATPSQGSISLSLTGLAGTGVTANVSFDYQSLSDTAAQLMVSLTNTTSPNSIGGFITGFAFNVPTIAGVTFTSIGGDIDDAGSQQTTALVAPNESGWYARYDAQGGIKTPNGAGDFDFGILNKEQANSFITGGTGGMPNIGLGVTTSFVLDLAGSGLDDLTNSAFEMLFMTELSTGGTAGSYAFGARFQGVNTGGGSDLAVGNFTPPPVIPVPPAVVMAVLGFLGTGVIKRRLA